MAFTTSTGVIAYPTTSNPLLTVGSDALSYLLNNLKLRGWSFGGHSNGTTTFSMSAFSSQIGATYWHPSAWIVLKMPTVGGLVRSFCFQQGSDGFRWRVKYSTSAGFTGGSPGLVRTPSATDEKIIYGGGTDASPTYDVLFDSASSYGHFALGDTSERFAFAFACTPSSSPTGDPTTAFVLDALNTSTFPEGDADPFVVYIAGPDATPLKAGSLCNVTDASRGPHAWLRKGTGSQAWMATPALQLNGVDDGGDRIFCVPGSLSPAISTAPIPILPVCYAKPDSTGAHVGWKGVSTLLRWNGNGVVTNDGLTGIAHSNSTVRVVMGDVSFPSSLGTSFVDQYTAEEVMTIGASDLTPPVVTLVSPAPTDPLAAFDPIVIDATDETALRRVFVEAKFASRGIWDVVHDGTSFSPLYAAGSTRSVVGGGYRYSLVRSTGWLERPVITCYAIDQAGNEAS